MTEAVGLERPAGWSLRTISLDECEARRIGGDPSEPGRYRFERNLEVILDADERQVQYYVRNDVHFVDSENEDLAEIKLQFAAVYDYEEDQDEPTEKQIYDYAPSVIVQVVPFLRELFASMSVKLGINLFTLPLTSVDAIVIGEGAEDEELGPVADLAGDISRT